MRALDGHPANATKVFMDNQTSVGSPLVYLGCYNKNTINWLADKCLFLKGLEAAKSKIKVQADSVSGESSLPGSSSHYNLTKEFCGVPFLRAFSHS